MTEAWRPIIVSIFPDGSAWSDTLGEVLPSSNTSNQMSPPLRCRHAVRAPSLGEANRLAMVEHQARCLAVCVRDPRGGS